MTGRSALAEANEPAPPGDEPSCQPAEVRALDTERVLALALASIREASPDAPSACRDAAPACEGPADGARCVYQLSLHPDVIRTTIWPQADDGALVEAEAFVARDLSGTLSPARIRAHRWAVEGPIRCRGESGQRSYGGGAEHGPVTTTEASVTCRSTDAVERPVRVTDVRLLGPRPLEAEVTTFEPSTLPPDEPTRVSIGFAPLPLALRVDNALRVTLRVGEHTLRPVAQVVTPERRRGP